MLIKHGQALIIFSRTNGGSEAINRFHNTNLKGIPLELYEYKDGDLDKLNNGEMNGGGMEVENEVVSRIPNGAHNTYSEFTMAV